MSTIKDISLGAERRRRAVGRVIIDARGDMTQTELGLKMGDIPQTTISRWERGTIDMTLEQALDVERALHIPLGTLARAGGYVDDDDRVTSVEEALRTDPRLDPELRQDMLIAYRSYVKTSERLANQDFARRGRRTAAQK